MALPKQKEEPYPLEPQHLYGKYPNCSVETCCFCESVKWRDKVQHSAFQGLSGTHIVAKNLPRNLSEREEPGRIAVFEIY